MEAEKKPAFTVAAAAALVLIVAFAILGRWDRRTTMSRPDPAGTPASTTSTASGALRMEVVTIASSTDLYEIRVEYPRFPDAPELSRQMDAYANDAIAQFTRTALENDEAVKATLQPGEAPTERTYALYVTWESAQLNPRFVSYVMNLYAFDGGANGRQELRSFNWDLQQQRDIPLSALFLGMPDYLQRISAYARQVLSAQLGDATDPSFLDSGTKPDPDNFQWYTFTDEAVNLYFPKYQVAPGAAGEQQVTIPRDAQGLY